MSYTKPSSQSSLAITRRGFTLMEVLIAVGIAGLVVAGGFRLISMSLRSLAEVRQERQLIAAAQQIWLRFRTVKDMPDSGQEAYDPDQIGQSARNSLLSSGMTLEWHSEPDSVPVEGLELSFKRVTVTLTDASGTERSTVIYLPQ